MRFVYYESIKRELKTRPMYECRGDERLKTKVDEDEFTEMLTLFVYYESMKRKLKIKPIYECRCDGRLQTKRFVLYAPTIKFIMNR